MKNFLSPKVGLVPPIFYTETFSPRKKVKRSSIKVFHQKEDGLAYTIPTCGTPQFKSFFPFCMESWSSIFLGPFYPPHSSLQFCGPNPPGQPKPARGECFPFPTGFNSTHPLFLGGKFKTSRNPFTRFFGPKGHPSVGGKGFGPQGPKTRRRIGSAAPRHNSAGAWRLGSFFLEPPPLPGLAEPEGPKFLGFPSLGGQPPVREQPWAVDPKALKGARCEATLKPHGG